ncbi:MAG TPA: [FeFe] hydrogenase H-cluster radical SAM maturase HydE [Candidatus Merdenecus merdavium]|nr:[FeFe] hydrogenase H-cluster radical SAM maturase HydE [Candidatus Merdenecus merdavium]
MIKLVNKLHRNHVLSKEEFIDLMDHMDQDTLDFIRSLARNISQRYFGNKVYVRGLIEFTNYCSNDCYYCGIRKGNKEIIRYHLTKEEIMECCHRGYQLGFRTFVLQGGEDPSYTDEDLVSIIHSMKEAYSDCAITLSIGERTYDSYQRLKESGVDRFLLRHETANSVHYKKLHPRNLSLENRKRCLYDLKELGFQVGTGFMVGSPYQTTECLAEDLLFIHDLKPHMVGIGPFIPHHKTPFKDQKPGSYEQTLLLISILRIMLPNGLLPATTSLGTLVDGGREQGILSGANVVMPNLSPFNARKSYQLYDNKLHTGAEHAEGANGLRANMKAIGYDLSYERGDFKPMI